MPTKAVKDACDLLDADHRTVKKLFTEYDELAGSKAQGAMTKKATLARAICRELTVHATIEEEIFYPQVRAAIKDDALLDEAGVEHASCKALIAEIETSEPSDPLFDAKVKVLGEYINHHVGEERNEMFPKARSSKKLDLFAIGEQLEIRKEALMAAEAATA